MKIKKFKLNSVFLALILALHFTLFLNFAIFRSIHTIFNNLEHFNIFFLISIPFTFIAVLNILFLPFSIKYFEKPFFIFLLLSGSAVNYAMYHYGVIFDPNMIENIFVTNSAEATSYANLEVFIWLGLTGILPSLILLNTKITHSGVLKDLMFKGASFAGSIIIILFIATFFYKDYASVIRNNSNLRKEVNPYYYVVSTGKYLKRTYFTTPMEYQYVGLDAVKLPSNKKNLVVYIVGETARSMNYELNGYNKETNAYTRNIKNLTSFKNVTSCGTATAASLPCMFSMLDKKDYSKDKFNSQDNLTDIIKRADVSTIWLDNNTGSQKITKNIEYVDIPRQKSKYCDGTVCTDDYFISDLQNQINKVGNNDGIIFLHIMGSHGPTYFKRYPKDHLKFAPDCPKSDIQNCTDEEITNAYDNTILFTDFVMAKIIKILDKNKAQYNTSMLYVSDHGESLGENGLYLHGMPYAVAPEQQTHVPLITWFSDETIKDKKIDQKCLKNEANNENFSHDNLTHTILGLLDIKTEVYNPNLDIIKKCKG